MQMTELTLTNFRVHAELTTMLSSRTVVRGDNAQGKSSLAEAIVWCLYGTDIEGTSKQDERLLRRGASSMTVTLSCVTDDGQPVRVMRLREQSQILTVNGKRQGAQQKIEALFGTLPEFLTVFTPGYFSAVEPKAARAILARCLPVVEKDKVLARMQPAHAEILSHTHYPMVDGIESTDFIAEKTRKELRACEDMHVRLQGEMAGIQGILSTGTPVEPTLRYTAEHAAQHRVLQAKTDTARQDEATHAAQVSALHAKRASLRAAYDACLAQWQTVTDTCAACGQALPQDRQASLHAAAIERNAALRTKMDALIAEGNALKAHVVTVQTAVALPDALVQAQLAQYALEEEQDRKAMAVYEAQCSVRKRAEARLRDVNTDILRCQDEEATLRLRIQALDEYRFTYVRLQHDILQTQFTHVRLQLVDANRETGEVRSVFRITWKGRPYRTLSQSEKVRCDVEIGRVLSKVRGETMPVFVDNAESVQDLYGEEFAGQVMAAYVADGALSVTALQAPLVSA